MDGFPGMRPGMMPPMGPGMMLPPGVLGMGEMPFPGPGIPDGPAWKRQRTDVMPFKGPSGASKETSVFYKTRLCHKFAEGHCPFGDRCNYAHGEADLRVLPPEGQQILENRAGKARLPGEGASPAKLPANSLAAAEKAGVKTTAYKSRLCTRFMQKGECTYGASCHFAHGYDDLQVPEGQPRPTGPSVPPMDGPGFDMPFPRPSMMMPGAPMMPPEFMAMAAMGGMPGPGSIMPPRPPPGPPPSGPPPQLAERSNGTPISFSPAGPGFQEFSFEAMRTPTHAPSDVPYLDRVKAACALMGLGPTKPKDVGRDAVEAAIMALQTGEAFQANVYADSLEVWN